MTDTAGMVKKVTSRLKGPKPIFFFKEWRKYRGLTQEELAEAMGVATSSISQLETGNQGWSDTTLLAMADALHCKPGDLLMRNPLDTEAPWSIWEQIKPARRPQALSVLKTFVDNTSTADEFLMTGTDGLRLHTTDDDFDGPGHSPSAVAGQRREAKHK